MTAFGLFLLSVLTYASAAIWHQWRTGNQDAVAGQVQGWSILGMIVAFLWGVATTPFWRHVFITLSVLTFASIMLPQEMKFFERHHSLVFAIPFAMGFIAANHGRSGVGTLASWAVLIVLLVATYRFVSVDPVMGQWLKSTIGNIFPGHDQVAIVMTPHGDPNCSGSWDRVQLRTNPSRFNPDGRCGWRIEHPAGCIFVQRALRTGDARAYGPLCPTNNNTAPNDAEWVWSADGSMTARIQLLSPR